MAAVYIADDNASLIINRIDQLGEAMSLSSAKSYALRAARCVDQKEASELLSKAILELALSIEDVEAKLKKLKKS